MMDRFTSGAGDPFRDEDCRSTDRVLEVFLDGESIGDLDYLELEALREHRDRCPICRGALERGRRLDAELARHADAELLHGAGPGGEGVTSKSSAGVEGLLDRVFDQVDSELAARVSVLGGSLDGAPGGVTAEFEERTRFASVRSLVAVGLAVAAGVTIGVALMWKRSADVERDAPLALVEKGARPISDLPAPTATGEGSGADDVSEQASNLSVDPIARPLGEVELPHAWRATGRSRLRSGGSASRQAQALVRAIDGPLLPYSRSLCALLPDDLGEDLSSVLDRAGARAVQILRERRSPEADRALLILAARDRDPGARAALSNRLPRLVRRGVLDRETRRLLLTLEDERVDNDLLDWAEGSFERSDDLVADLRVASRVTGVGLLVFDLWRGLRGRTLVEDEVIAERWFDGLGTGDALALAEILSTSNHAVDRIHAALACGAIGDPAASPALLELLVGHNRALRMVSGYALGRLPIGSDSLDRSRLPAGVEPARRAVLASRGDPVITRVIDRMALSEEERMFLLAGRFDPTQFEVAVALFQSRSQEAAYGF